MALTKNDLHAIKDLVVDLLEPIKTDIGDLKKGQKNIEENLARVESKLDYSIDVLDKDHLELRKKVEMYHPSN